MNTTTNHTNIIQTLKSNGFQSYIVGGAVRDILLGIEPHDYDLATNTTPEQIKAIFPQAKSVSATFHDVVYIDGVEVATLREDGPYSDRRRPDYTQYTDDIVKDLARRDFTINAMALDGDKLIDPFGGKADLEKGVLRAVGDPTDRIIEHPVRLLRAVRFAAKYGLTIDACLEAAMDNEAGQLRLVPNETVRDELLKGLDLDDPDDYLTLLHLFWFLPDVLPEIYALIGVEQNTYHNGSDVFEHTLEAVKRAPKGLARFAALLHDVGKPTTQEFVSGDYGYSFLKHEEVGATISDDICRRLRLTNRERTLVVTAVREHMSRITSPRTARRFLGRCGNAETARFVLSVMRADKGDRLSEEAERLVEAEIEKQSAIKVTDLAVNGKDVMETLNIKSGPQVGEKLNRLLEIVVNNPTLNTRDALLFWLTRLEHTDFLVQEKKRYVNEVYYRGQDNG